MVKRIQRPRILITHGLARPSIITIDNLFVVDYQRVRLM